MEVVEPGFGEELSKIAAAVKTNPLFPEGKYHHLLLNLQVLSI